MKKFLLLIVISTASFTQAQQEIKLDIFDALALRTVEISYEKYIDETSSFGLSVLFNFETGSTDFKYNEKRALTPFFRHYFTYENNWNVFGEGFFSLNFGENEYQWINGPNTYEDYTDGALGVAGGMKYISDGGFTIDFYVGVGRNLFNSNSPAVVPRAGLNVGWRF